METRNSAKEGVRQSDYNTDATTKTEENYQHLLEYAPSAIFEIDYRLPRFKNVNDAMCKLTGYTSEELLSINPFKLLETKSAERLKDRIKKGLTGESISKSVEYEVITKGGRHLWAEMHVKPIYRDGKLDTGLVVGYDVTESKKTGEELRDSEERFRLVAEAANVFVYEVDLEKSSFAVFRGEEVLGYKPGDIPLEIGWWFEQIHPDDRQVAQEKARAAIETGKNALIEYRIRRKCGDYVIVHDMSKMVRDEHGKVVRIIGGLRDVTERIRTEQTLEDYRKNLEKLVEERTEKLRAVERLAAIGETAGMIGHDIRNPLQAIVSELFLARQVMSEVKDKNTAEVLESIDSIQEQVDYISKIVQDLQDYARPLKVEYADVVVQDLIFKVFKTVPIPNKIKLKIDINGKVKFKTDATFIMRALTNLVMNAVQAMPDGGELSLTAYNKETSVIISIADTGKGIPEEAKPYLFKPLFTTKSKGQGLGLAVVKRLVEILGGKVSFETEIGKGSKFTVELPVNS